MMYSSANLSEVLTQFTDYIDRPEPRSYPKLSVKLYGKGVLLDEPADGATLRMQRHQLAKAGQVILSEIWGKKGAIGIVPPEGDGALCTSHFFLFDVQTDRVLPQYLHYIFSSNYLEPQLNKEAKGTTGYAAVRPKHLLAAEIPLPPVEEQRRIVAHIDVLAEQIAAARGLRHSAVEEAETLWYSSLRTIRESLSEAPQNRLGLTNAVTAGGTPSRDNPSYWNGNIPWIKTGELTDGDIYHAEEYISEFGLQNSSAKLFPPETILIALYGQGQTRGRTGRLMIEAATNQACCAILPNNELDSRFIQYWLRSLYLEMREVTRDGAQPNWNAGMIKQIEMSLIPMNEQRRIVAYLDSLQAEVERLKHLQAESAAELDALLPSLLDRAFRGDL